MPPLLPFHLLIDECIIPLNDIHIFIPDPSDRHCGICYNDYYYNTSTTPANQTPRTPISKLGKIKARFSRLKTYHRDFPNPRRHGSASPSVNDLQTIDDDGRIEIPILLPCRHHMGLDCLLKLSSARLDGTAEEENNRCPFCRHQLFVKGSDRPGWRPDPHERRRAQQPERPPQSSRSRPGRHPMDNTAAQSTVGMNGEMTEPQALIVMAKHLAVAAICFILSCLRYGLKLIIKKLADYQTAHENVMAEHYGLSIM